MSDGGLRLSFAEAHVARVATVGPDGAPHVAPAWFVWTGEGLFLSARQGSRTWLNAELDPRVSVVIDRGRDWSELSGVVLEGTVELRGPEDDEMRGAISRWHEKYRSLLSREGFEMFARSVERLGFLHLRPERTDAWNHRSG